MKSSQCVGNPRARELYLTPNSCEDIVRRKFLKKFRFFSARPGEGPASRFSSYQERLRRNPARRVNLVKETSSIVVMGFSEFLEILQ